MLLGPEPSLPLFSVLRSFCPIEPDLLLEMDARGDRGDRGDGNCWYSNALDMVLICFYRGATQHNTPARPTSNNNNEKDEEKATKKQTETAACVGGRRRGHLAHRPSFALALGKLTPVERDRRGPGERVGDRLVAAGPVVRWHRGPRSFKLGWSN